MAVVDRSEYELQLRIALLELLTPRGPRCARCGSAAEFEDLEIDHQHGRTWHDRHLNFLDRIRRQWREFVAGVPLRAVCKRCNASDGTRRFRGRPRYRRPAWSEAR